MMYFSKYLHMLVSIFLTAQFLTIASNDYCNGLFWNYPGYPECRQAMIWIKNHGCNGCDGSWCSVHRFLAKEGKCPDPDFWDMSTYGTENPNGSKTFTVYRAINSDAPSAHSLLNVNAGNLGGVLVYLHREVIPSSIRGAGGYEWSAHTRKFSIDAIMVYKVTIKAPPARHHFHPRDHVWGPYAAMDKGRCTAGSPCDFHSRGVWLPGSQGQGSYQNARWYSFPACGFCRKPSGRRHCTFYYELVGRISLDEVVGIKEGFYEFSKNGGIEDQLPFWENMWDWRLNAARVAKLGNARIDTSLAQPGIAPKRKLFHCPPQWDYEMKSLNKGSTHSRINGDSAFLIITVIVITLIICYLCVRTKFCTKLMFQDIGHQIEQPQIESQNSLLKSDYFHAFIVITLFAISIILTVLYLRVGFILLIVIAASVTVLNIIYVCMKIELFLKIQHRFTGRHINNQMRLPLIKEGLRV